MASRSINSSSASSTATILPSSSAVRSTSKSSRVIRPMMRGADKLVSRNSVDSARHISLASFNEVNSKRSAARKSLTVRAIQSSAENLMWGLW